MLCDFWPLTCTTKPNPHASCSCWGSYNPCLRGMANWFTWIFSSNNKQKPSTYLLMAFISCSVSGSGHQVVSLTLTIVEIETATPTRKASAWSAGTNVFSRSDKLKHIGHQYVGNLPVSPCFV